jgi:hypothetical protein
MLEVNSNSRSKDKGGSKVKREEIDSKTNNSKLQLEVTFRIQDRETVEVVNKEAINSMFNNNLYNPILIKRMPLHQVK